MPCSSIHPTKRYNLYLYLLVRQWFFKVVLSLGLGQLLVSLIDGATRNIVPSNVK